MSMTNGEKFQQLMAKGSSRTNSEHDMYALMHAHIHGLNSFEAVDWSLDAFDGAEWHDEPLEPSFLDKQEQGGASILGVYGELYHAERKLTDEEIVVLGRFKEAAPGETREWLNWGKQPFHKAEWIGQA